MVKNVIGAEFRLRLMSTSRSVCWWTYSATMIAGSSHLICLSHFATMRGKVTHHWFSSKLLVSPNTIGEIDAARPVIFWDDDGFQEGIQSKPFPPSPCIIVIQVVTSSSNVSLASFLSPIVPMVSNRLSCKCFYMEKNTLSQRFSRY